MRRLAFAALVLALLPTAAQSQEPKTVRVTGTVVLPKGQKIPQNAIVQVRIYFYQEGVGRVTYYSRIGSQTFQVLDPSKPLDFSVEVNKSYPDKHGPGDFLLKAYVFVKDGQKTKCIFASTDDDAVIPFTGTGKPKTNMRLPVSKED